MLCQARIIFSGLCPRTHIYVAQKLNNYQHEIDVTWQEYVMWWTLKMIQVWWHLTLTSEPESCFHIVLDKKTVNNLKLMEW